MRALPLRGACVAAVTSFFTSFGYFADPAEDAAMLAEIARVLRPGGRFLLDFLNAPAVRQGLQPSSRDEVDGWVIQQEREIREGRVEKRVRLEGPEGRVHEYTESVRLYERAELERALQSAGLAVTSAFGALDGTAWSEHSPRLVLLADS